MFVTPRERFWLFAINQLIEKSKQEHPSCNEIYEFIKKSDRYRIRHQRIFDNSYKSKIKIVWENLSNQFQKIVTDPSIPKKDKEITVTSTFTMLKNLQEKGLIKAKTRHDLPNNIKEHEKGNTTDQDRLTMSSEYNNIVNIPMAFTHYQQGYKLTKTGENALNFVPLNFFARKTKGFQ